MEKRIPKKRVYGDDPDLFRRYIHTSPLMPFLRKIGYREHLRLLTKGQFDMIVNYLDKGKLPK